MHVKSTCLSLIVILSGVFTSVTAQADESEWLELGLLAESRGDFEEALRIWKKATGELESSSSRIGFEYIRLVTQQGLTGRYAAATELYDYALSDPYRETNRAAVRQEIERLAPIAGPGIHRQWTAWFEEQNPLLAIDLRGFWKQLDPTPGSRINERLIEHWIRRHEIRQTYTRNRQSAYDSDDRGLIHIRYGRPDRMKRGVLTIDNQTLGQWISRQFDTAEPPRETERTPPTPAAADSREDPRAAFSRLEEYVFQFHSQPEYEVWIYDPFLDYAEEPVIFIFGTDPQSGEFRQLRSLDDLIPERAFLSDQRNQPGAPGFVRAGLTPALVLQLLYYEQLSDFDPWFRNRLNSIRTSYLEQGGAAQRSPDLALRTRNRELLDQLLADSPVEISTEAREIPNIPVELYQYRLLDENLNPLLITFLESRPTRALLSDLYGDSHNDPVRSDTLQRQPDEVAELYRLYHNLLTYDTDWQEEIAGSEQPSIALLPLSEEEAIIQSVFITGHVGQPFQSASATLVVENGEESNRYSPLFPPQLRALGNLKGRQPQPLESRSGQLELADLILGFRDDQLPEEYPFTFRVANDQTIPSDESLVLHFEVYNLTSDDETGFTRFELTYHIYPVLEDGTVVSGEEEFYLTIRFEDDTDRVAEDLEILTSELSRGLYELQVYIRDLVSGQEERRDIRFEVTGPDQGNIPIDS